LGYKIGKEIANANLDMAAKMSWHLSGNHVPAVDEVFIPVALEAIELAVAGEWERTLVLPNELERSVLFIVTHLHLEPFVPAMEVPKDPGEEHQHSVGNYE
jgi:hypothetical protein